MNIGNKHIPGPVTAAPMAGVTDGACRALLSEYGAALTYTEMVSAKGLLYNSKGTLDLLRVLPADSSPARAAQLFGRDPSDMARAAAIIAEHGGFDIIDINCGCPAPKVVRNGEGSALMSEPVLIGRLVEGARKGAGGLPVTVKLRKGFLLDENTAVAAAKAAEAAGAAALCVHGRTGKQLFTGSADWDTVTEVKRSVSIPVIGNGDIKTPEDAAKRLCESSCDAVMIGRAAWGNPWLIQRAAVYIETGTLPPKPTEAERITLAIRHLHMITGDKGERTGVREMRQHIHMYTKGIRGSSAARARINTAETAREAEDILLELINNLG